MLLYYDRNIVHILYLVGVFVFNGMLSMYLSLLLILLATFDSILQCQFHQIFREKVFTKPLPQRVKILLLPKKLVPLQVPRTNLIKFMQNQVVNLIRDVIIRRDPQWLGLEGRVLLAKNEEDKNPFRIGNL